MMVVNKVLSAVLINSLIIYIIAKYMPFLWFGIIPIDKIQCEVVVLIWAIFWLTNDVIKKIAKVITFPLRVLTVWIFSIVLNVGFFYIFKWFIDTYVNGVSVQLWSILQIILLSIVIWLLNLLFRKL